jgi:hypothetical protein
MRGSGNSLLEPERSWIILATAATTISTRAYAAGADFALIATYADGMKHPARSSNQRRAVADKSPTLFTKAAILVLDADAKLAPLLLAREYEA